MSIPDFQSFFKPLLECSSDGKEHSIAEARNVIARKMSITDAERAELLPSGTQSKFDNRVAWAKSYFVQAKVFESPKRGWFVISDRGRDLLKQGHNKITVKELNQYQEFVSFHTAKKENDRFSEESDVQLDETPEETLQKSYQSIRNDLAGELLTRIQNNSSTFFEHLVVDLMIAMGYGGSRADAGRSLGKSGDEGLDGLINEDKLGLDIIYLQAKRWEGTIGRPEIQKFVGALHGRRAKKGVFITTSSFTKEAKDYIATIDPRVILIDGRQLAELMIDHGLGVSLAASYEIKKMDSDYFEEA